MTSIPGSEGAMVDECCMSGNDKSDDTLLMACEESTDKVTESYDWNGMTCTHMFKQTITRFLSDGIT